MSEFDAFLKRSFAEAPDPVDDGFSANVAHAVARSEKALQMRTIVQNVGMAAGGAVALYGAYAFVGPYAVDLLAPASSGVANIGQSFNLSPAVGDVAGAAAGQAQTLMHSLGAGLTQVLLIVGALAGGAVAFRAAQQD